MIELLQFLFATEKDQNLYNNRERLIKELVFEHQFSPSEVSSALAWFSPVVDRDLELLINPLAIRSISDLEERVVPKIIIEQIFECEREQRINLADREILLDRLAELGLDWKVDSEDMQPILDGLIHQLNNYRKIDLVGLNIPSTPYYLANSLTVH